MSLALDTTSPYAPARRASIAALTGWILPVLVLSRRVLTLWGPPGVGKSAIPEAWAAAQGLSYRFLSVATAAPEDIGGIPTRDEGRIVRLLIGALRDACEQACLLHIDEITCASPAMLGAILSAIQDRRVGDARLHPDTVILLSGNPPSTTSGTTSPPAALVNRCAHYYVTPTAIEVASYFRGETREASYAKVDRSVTLDAATIRNLIADLIEASPTLLEVEPPPTCVDGYTWASPRALDCVADEIAALVAMGADVVSDPRVREVLLARLGAKGAAFAGVLAAAAKLPKPREIAADPLHAPVPDPKLDLDAALACVAVLPSVGAIDAGAAWVWAARFAAEIGVIMAGACKRAAPVPAGGFKGKWAKEATQALTAIGVKEAKAHAGRI